MKTKFISFFSDRNGTNYYRSCGAKLAARLEQLGAKHHIEELPSHDNYMLNCLMKPEFILNTIINLDEPVIWIDVDCVVNSLPTQLSDLDCDIALCLREHDGKTPHSALIYFNNTEKSIAFIREWVAKCKTKEAEASVGEYTLSDHEQLILTFRENVPEANIIAFSPEKNVCTVMNATSNVNVGLSGGEADQPRESKLQALYPPFRLEDGSSCGKLDPVRFKWVSQECPVQVFIDNGMNMVPSHPKKEGYRFYGWLCESRAIVPELYSALKSNYGRYFEYFDAIFTCDETLLSLDDRFKFSFSGSNAPWTPVNQYGVHEKTKNCSLLASPKKSTKGHALRHELAEKYANEVDLFGGLLGSPKIGTTDAFASSAHPPKTEALRDYRFSITIENDSYNNYFTEKITDCFANGTIPVYWGCPNIGDYFNTDGIILLTDDFDVNDLTDELYESKMEAVRDNYQRVRNMPMSDDVLFGAIVNDIDGISS